MTDKVRFEGLTLTVESVERALAFYRDKIGLTVEWNEALKEGVADSTPEQKAAAHVEFSTDDLDGLYEELEAKGVAFLAPHDEPWERSMTALDPDGYAVEFAQGRRGHNPTKPSE